MMTVGGNFCVGCCTENWEYPKRQKRSTDVWCSYCWLRSSRCWSAICSSKRASQGVAFILLVTNIASHTV